MGALNMEDNSWATLVRFLCSVYLVSVYQALYFLDEAELSEIKWLKVLAYKTNLFGII